MVLLSEIIGMVLLFFFFGMHLQCFEMKQKIYSPVCLSEIGFFFPVNASTKKQKFCQIRHKI